MTWLIAKTLFSNAFDWIVAHWQLVLFALMVLAIWHYQSDYKAAVKELADYKQEQTALAEKQVKDNKAKFDTAVLTQAKSDAITSQQVADLHIDKETLTNAIKGYYAPNHTKSNMVPNVGIVLPKPSGSSSGSSTTTSSEQGLTSSGAIPDASCAGLRTQLETLQDATALETILYNKSRARIDQDCAQIGCLE